MPQTENNLPQVSGNRVPPNSLEAEQSVLGSMLLSEDCVILAVDKLKEHDFYTPMNRRIWRAMRDLTAVSKPVDLVTVTERLEQKEKLTIEELTYLTDLTQRVPSVKNLQVYIDIIREKSLLRQTLEACGDIAEMSYRGDATAQQVLNYAGEIIYKIADDRGSRSLEHIRQALIESFESISKAAKSKDGLMGISTGFPLMDKTLSGLQAAQLIVVAGKTGMGKTSFALNIVEHVGTVLKRPVAVFSLEMSRDQLATRLITGKAQVDSQKARVGELTEKDFFSLADAMVPLEESAIFIDDTPTIGPTEILAKLRRMKREQGDLGLVVIDYLQLMTMGNSRAENRQLEIAQMTRSLKIMAREMAVPVIVLSQLKRVGDKRENQAPQLSDLRESGAIEQDADVVLFLHRDDYFGENGENTGRSRIIIAKQRSGPTGSIEVKWRGEMTKYFEVDFIHEEE